LSVIKEVTVKKPVRRWRGLLIVAAVLIVAALLLAACGSSSTSSSSSPTAGGEPKAGGTYNFPLGAEPISIEPLNTQESEGWHVNHQVFQGLYCLQIQPDGVTTKAVPDLAEKTEVNADGTVFTFTIKKGVMFQAPVSREVTAQDFVDSWNYNSQAKNKSATTYIIAPIKGISPDTGYAEGPTLSGLKVIDKYTFEVTLQYPFADFPATLVHPITQVLPVDYAKKIGAKKFFDKPVGTGPYMIDSWQHNQSITLVKNPDYWNTSNSGNSATPGYVDTINMPIYTDTSTEWLAFQKGTLDYSTLPTGNFKAAQNNPSTKDGTWTVKAYPSTSVYFISVAMNKPTLGGDANLPIRAALNYAADREVVSNIVNEGITIPSDSIVPVTIPGYVAGNNPYAYDPAKAQPELDKFTGTLPSEIPYWFNSGSGHDKIAQALVDGWTKAMPSLKFKLGGVETNSYWTQAGENKFDGLVRMGWIADYPSIDNFIYLFTTAGGKYGSYSFYSNPEVDKLFEQARATVDETARFNLYNEAEKMILTDAPCVPVYTYRDARATNNRIGGFTYNSFAQINMWDVWVK
jgi:oligopeptide transport system substrate-binding protein